MTFRFNMQKYYCYKIHTEMRNKQGWGTERGLGAGVTNELGDCICKKRKKYSGHNPILMY